MDFNPVSHHHGIDDDTDGVFWDTVRRRDHSHREQDLMLAVLKDALLNYRKNLQSRNRLFRDEREWFFGAEADWLFSFESVCGILGLNCQHIRKHLRAWDEANDAARINSQRPRGVAARSPANEFCSRKLAGARPR
jgi:hypothetical protein